MKLKLRQLILLLFVFSYFATESQVKKYELKKGQAFDIIFLNTNADAGETQKKYFEEAFPIAKKSGYMPQKGFGIKQPPLQGNYWPAVMVIGIWEDFDKREQFVNSIVNDVPDFHEMRREIWTTFNLTYWKVSQDYSFEVDSEKYNVVTAYWSNNDEEYPKFRSKWLKQVEKSGGNKLIGFFKGTSPFGYEYNPDHLTITEWESKEAFDKFNEEIQNMDHQSVRHVNQFIIE